MLLEITHGTNLSYDDLINESVMELRMSPRQEEGQRRLAFNLAIGPATTVFSYFDWLGNTVHALTINAFHKHVRVVATSVVEINRAIPDVENLQDTWPIGPQSLDYSMYDYLQLNGPIVDCPELQQLSSRFNDRRGQSLGKLALDLTQSINEQFVYEKGVTTAASPITDLLQHGRGVCQDFTHLLIGLARKLGIPARYVSGVIHRDDGHDFRGHAQTHAWCELLFPSVGWIGFDPTNNCLAGPNFVKVAHGRDFRDVPPNRGVYRGTAKETIAVAVSIRELPTIPGALAPEQYQTIDLEVFPHRRQEHVESAVNQQQEQQQQEMRQQQEQQQQET
ncbi:MAG TPA: transglutaminase family protein, partial [Tepidisphaeraceae bacterium]|nr:transglutaminase family protein [Tepidisphaeraceae bacterium]